MKSASSPILRLTIALVLTSALSGCASRLPKVTDTACAAFAIIHPSRADTAETKRQVLEHNTTYRRICISTK